MVHSPDLSDYAAKMRRLAHSSTDLEVDARFIDMLAPRGATELFDAVWFRQLSVTDLSPGTMADHQLPESFDLILMSGNVPAFLTRVELSRAFATADELLAPGGRLIVGTTTHRRGGPADLDHCSAGTSLGLEHRYGDWHLGTFDSDSPWSVSIYSAPGARRTSEAPDGIHLLPPN